MTAINLLLMPDAVHIFTDAGHYREDQTLIMHARKVYPLPRWNASLLFNGPSIGGPAIHRKLSYATGGSWEAHFTEVVHSIIPLIGARPFSAILVGFGTYAPFGLAIEEGSRYHLLKVGTTIRALKSSVQFDPSDIISSGLQMVRDQRKNYPVVSGWCDYTRIDPSGINTRILERFDG